MKRLFFAATIAILSIGTINAQGRVDGFYKGKGNLDLVLGGGAEINSKFYAGNELVNLSRTITNSNVFLAYGILEKLDVNISAPYVMVDGNGGLQDGAIYLKYAVFEKELSKGKLSFTLAAGYSTPLSDYETEGITAIGQQASVIDARPLIHYFANNGWFGTAQFGMQTKSDPTPNAMGAALKIGKASDKYYYDFWYEFQESDGGFDYLGIPAAPSFKALGADFHRVGLTYYRPIKEKLGFFIGGAYTLAGRNVGQGFGINTGIVLKR